MCNGTIESLDGQTVTLTGKVSIRGEWLKRDRVVMLLSSQGISYKKEMSKLVTVLVRGDLEGQHVVNPSDQCSQRVEFVRSELKNGRHICVVTSRGFSGLLEGTVAECQTRKLELARVRL